MLFTRQYFRPDQSFLSSAQARVGSNLSQPQKISRSALKKGAPKSRRWRYGGMALSSAISKLPRIERLPRITVGNDERGVTRVTTLRETFDRL